MTEQQRIGDFFIKSLNLILDSLERHRKRIVLCGIDMAGEHIAAQADDHDTRAGYDPDCMRRDWEREIYKQCDAEDAVQAQANDDVLNQGICAVCGLSPCACGTGHMGEVE